MNRIKFRFRRGWFGRQVLQFSRLEPGKRPGWWSKWKDAERDDLVMFWLWVANPQITRSEGDLARFERDRRRHVG